MDRRARGDLHHGSDPGRGGGHRPGADTAAAARRGQDRQRQGQGRDGALQAARADRLRRAHRAPAAADRHDLRHHGRARDADLGGRHQGRHPARVVLRGHLHHRPDDRARSRSRRSRSPARCRTAPRGRGRRRPRASKRHLWGDGKGRFRTGGRFSSATVRGTRWVVSDRCDGTLTRVVRGSVTVRDRVHNKTVILHAGEQYLARAPGSRRRELGLRLRRLPRRPHGGRLPAADRLAGAPQARRPQRPGRPAPAADPRRHLYARLRARLRVDRERARCRLGRAWRRCSSSSRT